MELAIVLIVVLAPIGFLVLFGVMLGTRIRTTLARRSAAAAVAPYVAPPALPAHTWSATTLSSAEEANVTRLLYPSDHPHPSEPTEDAVSAAKVTTLNGIAFTMLRHTRHWHDSYVYSVVCLRAAFPQTSIPRLRVCARHGQGTDGALADGDTGVEFESDAFNHAYRVYAEDPRRAYEVISPSMIECLLAAPSLAVAVFDRGEVFLAFEIPEHVAGGIDVDEPLLAYFVGMLDRVPARVWGEWRPGGISRV